MKYLLFLIFFKQIVIGNAYHSMYQKSSLNTVIYNLKSGCKSCATINSEKNLIFTECSVTYLSSQRFDILFEKYTNNFHSITSRDGLFQLSFQNLSKNFELVIANGRRGFFIVSEENSNCLTNNIDNPFPYSLNNSNIFRSCKRMSKNDEDIIFYFQNNLELPKTQYLANIDFLESNKNDNVLISQEFLDEMSSNMSQISISLSSNTESYSNLKLKPNQEIILNISESDYIFNTNIDSLVNQNYGCTFIINLNYKFNKITTPFYNRERCSPNVSLRLKVAILKMNTYIIKFKNQTRNIILDSSIFEPSSSITFTNSTNDIIYSYEINQLVDQIAMNLSFGKYTSSFNLAKNLIYDTNFNNNEFTVDNCNSNNIIFINVKEIAVLVNFEMKDDKTLINYDTSILSSSIIMINQDLNIEFELNNLQSEFSLMLNKGNYIINFPFNENYENLTTSFSITDNDINEPSITKIIMIKALCKVTFNLKINETFLSTEILELNSMITIRKFSNSEIISYVINNIVSEFSLYLGMDSYVVESLNIKTDYNYYSFENQEIFQVSSIKDEIINIVIQLFKSPVKIYFILYPNTSFNSSVFEMNSNILFSCIRGSENNDVNYINSSVITELNTNLYVGTNNIYATISDSLNFSIKTTDFIVSRSNDIQVINLYFYRTKAVLFKLKNSVSNTFYNTSIIQLNSKITFSNIDINFYYLVKDNAITEFTVILNFGNYIIDLILSNTSSFEYSLYTMQVNADLTIINIPIISKSSVEKLIKLEMSIYNTVKNTYTSTIFQPIYSFKGFIFSCLPVCNYPDIYYNTNNFSSFKITSYTNEITLRTNFIYTTFAVYDFNSYVLDNPTFSVLNTTTLYTFNIRFRKIEKFYTTSEDLQLDKFKNFVINCQDDWGLYNMKYKLSSTSDKIYVEYECIELGKLYKLSYKNTNTSSYSQKNKSNALLTLSNHYIDCGLGFIKSISFVDINGNQFRIDYSCYSAYFAKSSNKSNTSTSHSVNTSITTNNTVNRLTFLNVNRTNPILTDTDVVKSISGIKFSHLSSSISIQFDLLGEN